MISKDFLQQYFHADYRGAESILKEVLEPIFGSADVNNQSIITTPTDKQKAQHTNIMDAHHIATLWPLGSDESIKVFDVTIEDRCHIHIARKRIQHLVREWVDRFEGAFIIFHYANTKGRSWRLSYMEKRAKNADSTSAKRYTYLCGQDYPCRTIAERFSKISPDNINSTILEDAFSAEALSDEFFVEYKNFYDDFVNYVTQDAAMYARFMRYAKNDEKLAQKSVRDYIKKLMGRLVFIQFLQKKAWLNNDLHYMQTLFKESTEKQKEDYLDNVLEPLFFGVFNTKEQDRAQLFNNNRWDKTLLTKWADFPYLNGGLFECDDLDELRLPIPSYFFSNPEKKDNIRKPTDKYYEDACGIFDFFERYNFTIDESDPLDTEVGVDPEMLGKIFENLLEDNKDKGAFYTPKEIVQYMCKESLIAYLVSEAKKKNEASKQSQANFEEAIRAFVNDPEMTVTRIARYSEKQLTDLLESLQSVKICDPAIGSGAFPMGLLNLLVNCREALNKALGENVPRAELKQDIILNNIYGVDIEKGAIDIARLRFWLSIVVDLENPKALPNFDYKFMQGNSLLEQYSGVDLSNMFATEEETNKKINGKNVGVAPLIIFDEEQVPRTILQEKMNRYFSMGGDGDKHTMRQEMNKSVVDLVKGKTLGKTVLHEKLSNIDVSANEHFFLWHTWFADVFENGGFDIVIGNPPYGELRDLTEEQQEEDKQSKYFKYATGGRVNLFQFFYPLGIDIVKKGGIVQFIVQNSLLAEETTINNRKFMFEQSKILLLDSFPERYDINKRVFKSVTMSVCICMLKKGAYEDFDFNIHTWNDKYMSSCKTLHLRKSQIQQLYPMSLIFPSCDEKEFSLLVKIKQKSNYHIFAQAGEIDLTKYSPYFTQNFKDIRVVTGSNVAPYYIAEQGQFGKNIFLPLSVVRTLSRQDVRNHKRIVMQRITGVNAKRRFQGAILENSLVCGNSTNYISESDNSIDLLYLLGILNSSLLTYFDKLTNTNANITARVLNSLPIYIGDTNAVRKISSSVTNIIELKQLDPSADTSDLENQIDELVYDLYGLTEPEKEIIRKS